MRIKETVIVEGKDDQSAVLAAVDANVICTHGYGIAASTIELIKTAYETTGIIIFTDPDHAGLSIRNKLTSLFPDALQAHLTADEAFRDGDIGIENAAPDAIVKALTAAGACERNGAGSLNADDMFALGLSGMTDSAARRNELGKKLGIGCANTKTFLRRLNALNISREELAKMI